MSSLLLNGFNGAYIIHNFLVPSVLSTVPCSSSTRGHARPYWTDVKSRPEYHFCYILCLSLEHLLFMVTSVFGILLRASCRPLFGPAHWISFYSINLKCLCESLSTAHQISWCSVMALIENGSVFPQCPALCVGGVLFRATIVRQVCR